MFGVVFTATFFTTSKLLNINCFVCITLIVIMGYRHVGIRNLRSDQTLNN